MIDQLATEENLESFEGVAARVRCFLHILNIVGGKNLVNHFDTRARKKPEDGDQEDDIEIAELVGDEDAGDEDAIAEDADEEDGDDDGDGSEGRGEDGDELEYDAEALDSEEEVDAMGEMSEEEQAEFTEAIRPVKLILAKVSLLRVQQASGELTMVLCRYERSRRRS